MKKKKTKTNKIYMFTERLVFFEMSGYFMHKIF